MLRQRSAARSRRSFRPRLLETMESRRLLAIVNELGHGPVPVSHTMVEHTVLLGSLDGAVTDGVGDLGGDIDIDIDIDIDVPVGTGIPGTEPEIPCLAVGSVAHDAAQQKITIAGTKCDDEATVDVFDDGGVRMLHIELNTTTTLDVAASDVEQIVFHAQEGDDLFDNNTNVFSIAYGHAGDDSLYGGSAADTFYGGEGDDYLEGGGGDDTLFGEEDADTLYGNAGDDLLYGGEDDDELYGGGDDDYLSGKAGNDTLRGNNGNDTGNGGDGDDIIYGGDGADTLNGNDGADTIEGGNDNDTLTGGGDADTLYGQNGSDEIDGGSGADTIYGGNGADTLNGDGGNDEVHGGAGDDALNGGNGADELYGDSGDDTLHGDAGGDTLYGGSDDDNLYGDAGSDNLKGMDGDDGLFGGEDTDVLRGGNGNDRFLCWDGDAYPDYNASADAVIRLRDTTSDVDVTLNGKERTYDPQAWTEDEIEKIDEAFAAMHQRVGDVDLLETSTGGTVTYYRAGYSQGDEGFVGWNSGGSTIYIVQVAFDKGDDWLMQTIYHEMAHAWDGENPMWEDWLEISDWEEAGSGGTGTVSGNGDWCYDAGTSFARSYGTYSPYEDFATAFANYFMDYTGRTYQDSSGDDMTEKFDFLDDFFALL